MMLNSFREVHFLDLVDYTPQWGCQEPDYPDNRQIADELRDIGFVVDSLEGGGDAARQIDKVDTSVDQEFYNYHQLVDSKMSSLWGCIRRTIQLGEERKLEDLSKEDLEDLVGRMLEELSEETPNVMFMAHNKRKVYYKFYDLFEAWGLQSVVFFPQMDGSHSFVHGNYADKITKVHWCGKSVLFTHADQAMKVEENGIRCYKISKDSRIGTNAPLILFSTLAAYFKDWKKPEIEEINLFKMLFPEVGYNLDVIRAGAARI